MHAVRTITEQVTKPRGHKARSSEGFWSRAGQPGKFGLRYDRTMLTPTGSLHPASLLQVREDNFFSSDEDGKNR